MSEKPSQRALSKVRKNLISRPPPPWRRTFPEGLRDFLLMLLCVKFLGVDASLVQEALRWIHLSMSQQ